MNLTISKHNARGDETKESITLEVLEDCNLIDYMIADATFDSLGEASNLHRHTFWFQSQAVKKGDTIVLNTRSGKPATTKSGTATQYQYFWGLGGGIWNDSGDKAVLVQIAKRQVFTLTSPKK